MAECVSCGNETTNTASIYKNHTVRAFLWAALPVADPPFCEHCMELTIGEVHRNVQQRNRPRIGMGGSRQWRNDDLIIISVQTLKQLYGDYVIVYGAHWEGADAMIKKAAERHKIELDPFPADWQRYERPKGKNPAGQIRNEQMAKSGLTMHLAFRSKGKSPGTDGMRDYCIERCVPTFIIPEHASESFLYRLLTGLDIARTRLTALVEKSSMETLRAAFGEDYGDEFLRPIKEG